ncbi:hypothetical protein BDV29DRAFT_166998 [Aspergillus leporis]|uniref:Uncharacterized protein n=1 Tax=Aspergillus leporis TaxID=41062 RepID=A0A5N5XBY3_9EURO|nr:hypothetical protein BDV29DRAFT_166998 [Aspergillus leporis]
MARTSGLSGMMHRNPFCLLVCGVLVVINLGPIERDRGVSLRTARRMDIWGVFDFVCG